MTSYKIIVTDKEGDKLKITTAGGLCSLDGTKFSLSIDSDKIKRLVDSISSLGILLTDFDFKELNIEKID